MDERIKTLAHNLVNYSCGVKEGDKVYVHYIGNDTEPLARAIIKEVYLAKGIPFVHNTEPRVQREVIMHCTEEQLRLMAKLDCEEMSQMDCYIAVRGTDNVSELSDVPAEKMNLYEKFHPGAPRYSGAQDPLGGAALSQHGYGTAVQHQHRGI